MEKKKEAMKTLNFKVTAEFICEAMIDDETLNEEYDGFAIRAYRDISDNYNDSVINFTDKKEKIISVEII